MRKTQKLLNTLEQCKELELGLGLGLGLEIEIELDPNKFSQSDIYGKLYERGYRYDTRYGRWGKDGYPYLYYLNSISCYSRWQLEDMGLRPKKGARQQDEWWNGIGGVPTYHIDDCQKKREPTAKQLQALEKAREAGTIHEMAIEEIVGYVNIYYHCRDFDDGDGDNDVDWKDYFKIVYSQKLKILFYPKRWSKFVNNLSGCSEHTEFFKCVEGSFPDFKLYTTIFKRKVLDERFLTTLRVALKLDAQSSRADIVFID